MLRPENESDGPPSVYEATAEPVIDTRPLPGSRQVQVAIVGAGLTGLSTALHLARQGIRDVVVLEAKSVGWGASGRAFGSVVPSMRKGPGAVIEHYGAEHGARILEAVGKGPEVVFGLIDEYEIGCQPVRTGVITAAHSPDGRKRLEAQAEYLQARGAPVEMLERDATSRLLGTPFYDACLLDRRGGNINPLGYVRGMARAVAAEGIPIHRETPVRTLTRAGDGWRLQTPSGEVSARKVVLATDGYSDRLFPGLNQTYVAMRGNLMVSKPLPANALASILPERQPMTDTRRLFSGVRILADGRMHVGANGPLFGRRTGPDIEDSTRRVLRLFPQLGQIEWDEAWSGLVGYTLSEFPHIHQLAPNLFTGLGFSGRGLVLSTIFGRELATHVGEGDVAECAFPMTPMEKVFLHGFAPFGAIPTAWLKGVLDWFDDRRFGRVGHA